jgi:hypothetical protein
MTLPVRMFFHPSLKRPGILVARRVEQVEREPLMLEAITTEETETPSLAAYPDFARELHRPAKQQRFFRLVVLPALICEMIAGDVAG